MIYHFADFASLYKRGLIPINVALRLEHLRVRWFNKQSELYLSLSSLYCVHSFVRHNRSKHSTQNYNAH